MKLRHSLFLVIIGLVLCMGISGVALAAEDSWFLTIEGPDGITSVSGQDFTGQLSEYQVSVVIDGDSFTGVPVWRVVRLADSEKSLGPGDIVTITGTDKSTEVAYPKIHKNESYLLVFEMNGAPLGDTIMDSALPFAPLMYLGPGFIDGTQVGGVDEIAVHSTDDWSLLISTGSDVSQVTKDEWDSLLSDAGADTSGPDDMVLSGVPVSSVLEYCGIEPGDGAIVTVTGEDGYCAEIPWREISSGQQYILASQIDGETLPKFLPGLFGPEVLTPAWPLILVDPEFPGEKSVGNIAGITISG